MTRPDAQRERAKELAGKIDTFIAERFDKNISFTICDIADVIAPALQQARQEALEEAERLRERRELTDELLSCFERKFWRYERGEWIWVGQDIEQTEIITEPLQDILKRLHLALEGKI